jgi:hypothetical protein
VRLSTSKNDIDMDSILDFLFMGNLILCWKAFAFAIDQKAPDFFEYRSKEELFAKINEFTPWLKDQLIKKFPKIQIKNLEDLQISKYFKLKPSSLRSERTLDEQLLWILQLEDLVSNLGKFVMQKEKLLLAVIKFVICLESDRLEVNQKEPLNLKIPHIFLSTELINRFYNLYTIFEDVKYGALLNNEKSCDVINACLPILQSLKFIINFKNKSYINAIKNHKYDPVILEDYGCIMRKKAQFYEDIDYNDPCHIEIDPLIFGLPYYKNSFYKISILLFNKAIIKSEKYSDYILLAEAQIQKSLSLMKADVFFINPCIINKIQKKIRKLFLRAENNLKEAKKIAPQILIGHNYHRMIYKLPKLMKKNEKSICVNFLL